MERQIEELERTKAVFLSGRMGSKDRKRIDRINRRIAEIRSINRSRDLNVVERVNEQSLERENQRSSGRSVGIQTERTQQIPHQTYKIIRGETTQFVNPNPNLNIKNMLGTQEKEETPSAVVELEEPPTEEPKTEGDVIEDPSAELDKVLEGDFVGSGDEPAPLTESASQFIEQLKYGKKTPQSAYKPSEQLWTDTINLDKDKELIKQIKQYKFRDIKTNPVKQNQVIDLYYTLKINDKKISQLFKDKFKKAMKLSGLDKKDEEYELKKQ